MSANPSRRLTARLLLLLPIMLLLLSIPLSAASAPPDGAASVVPSALDRQVREWVTELARQKPFADWRTAVPDIQPIGPGTHGWLALLAAHDETVGYLVVYAAADGSYRLGEYGLGPSVLFSKAALQRTLQENGHFDSEKSDFTAKRFYLHPFAALWEVEAGGEPFWIDAKTGEMLPFDRKTWSGLLPSVTSAAKSAESAGKADRVSSLVLQEPFDPYDKLPWLTGEKPFPAENAAKVQRRLRSGLHLRYVTEPYGEAALYALPVVGYQMWSNGRLDLALEMEGVRFVPLTALKSFGRLYR